MAINPDILSQVKNAPKINEETRDFLLWALDYEESTLDMELPRFKKEYSAKLDQLLDGDRDK